MAEDYYEGLSVGTVRDRQQIIGLDAYWKDLRLAYDGSNNLQYMGFHYLHNAATSDSGWEVWKFTYSGSTIVRREGPLPGAWDDRATLSWG